MDREARGNQRGVAGTQRDRIVDASPQVQARGPGRRVGGKLRADPLVEDPDVEFFPVQRTCLSFVTLAPRGFASRNAMACSTMPCAIRDLGARASACAPLSS